MCATYKNTLQNFESFWKHLKIFELTEVTKQRGDSQLINLLNHVWLADIKPTDTELLQSRVIQPWNDQHPNDTLHIFAENADDNQHNLKMLQLIESPRHMIPATDHLPKNIPQQKINEILNCKQSETGGLAQTLHIKLNAQVMLTVKIDLQDRLVNGQLGTIKHISIDTKGNVAKIYLKFHELKAGLKKINKDAFAKKHC